MLWKCNVDDDDDEHDSSNSYDQENNNEMLCYGKVPTLLEADS